MCFRTELFITNRRNTEIIINRGVHSSFREIFLVTLKRNNIFLFEDLLPFSQDPTIGFYPEPAESQSTSKAYFFNA